MASHSATPLYSCKNLNWLHRRVAGPSEAVLMILRAWKPITFAFSLLFLCVTAAHASSPTISSLSPTAAAVGATVTITGTSFGTQANGSVTFNGTVAAVASWNATTIKVTVPYGATTGNVVVIASGVNSNGSTFTVLPTPSVTSLSPAAAAHLASVTISGTGFGSSQGSGTVKFNGSNPAIVANWSDTSISVTVPSGATTGNVVVFASGVNSSGSSFTVLPAPTITGLSVTSGYVGTAVTVTGTNFESTQGSGTVSFNGTLAPIASWSATSIAVTVPNGASSGYVVVSASGVNSNGWTFDVTPIITSLTPTSGASGAAVTITGNNFGPSQGNSVVRFDGYPAPVVSWSPTSIVVTVPNTGETGTVVVDVGDNSNGSRFTVVPTITSLSPTSGAVGTVVTISGTGFGLMKGVSTVGFNGATAVITSRSESNIGVMVPNGATTGNVIVTVGGLASNGVNFTVAAAASLQITSPTSGSIVSPGQPMSVSVVSPANISFTQVAIIGEDPIGFSSIATQLPAQLSMSVPAVIACGSYMLTAFGTTGTGPSSQSATILVDVERSDLPLSLSAQQAGFTFETQGETAPVQILGTFSDGTILDVTESSYMAYGSSNTAVVTLDATGAATAVGPGNAWVSATYIVGSQLVQPFVQTTVLTPQLTASPPSLNFGNQNVGTPATQQVTLTNSGSTPMTILSLATGGDFSETDNCVSSSPLAVGATCTITVSFTPSFIGADNGAISISNSLQGALTGVPFAGIGTAPPGP